MLEAYAADDKRQLPIGPHRITQRMTSRYLPDIDRVLPCRDNTVKVWLCLNYMSYGDEKGTYWVRLAYADDTWKTIERDVYCLTLEDATDIFERLSAQLGRLSVAPCIDDLLAAGFGFG